MVRHGHLPPGTRVRLLSGSRDLGLPASRGRVLAAPHDALITNWRMPGLEAPELARRVRAHSDAPGRYTYIIFLTVLADPTHMRQAMEAGADQHLGKPYELEQLEAAHVVVE